MTILTLVHGQLLVVLRDQVKVVNVLVRYLEKHTCNEQQIVLLEEGLALVDGTPSLSVHGSHPLLHTGWLVSIVVGTNLYHLESYLTDFSRQQILKRYIICEKVFLGHDVIDVHFASIVLADILVSLVVFWPLLINFRLWTACEQFEYFVFDHVWHKGPHDLLIELCLADGLAP